MTFTADQVWGLAVRADAQNDGYLKEDRWEYVAEGSADTTITHTANKKLVKQWLRENLQPTEAEVAQGREYRRFFNTFTMKALMGGLTDFERQALRIAQMDEFQSNNMLEFALVSCLPASVRREQARTELKREVFTSNQLPGQPRDLVQGQLSVVGAVYSQQYGRWRITARFNDSFVDFWFPKELKGTVVVRAKIKQHREDNTTQLNYVKIVD
jgi:hypothetical protein